MRKLDKCPVCEGVLYTARLVCHGCRAEFPVDRPLSPYEKLDPQHSEMLEVFLRSKGNFKTVCDKLGISYPTAKKRLDALLVELGFEEEQGKEIAMDKVHYIDLGGSQASDIVKRKLYAQGGKATIPLLDGKPCEIVMCSDGTSFTSDKLNDYRMRYDYTVFDVITDLLVKAPNGRAPKGCGHGKDDKVGYGKCTGDTVVGAVAIHYFGKCSGDSTYDPVFVLAAVLDWAGIAKNQRGYLQLIDR